MAFKLQDQKITDDQKWSINILVGCQMEREREKDNRKSNTFELYPDLLSRTFIVIPTSEFI